MAETDFEFEHDDSDFKSKTQLKNEMQALQKMGETLVDLGPAALAKIPLDDELANAINLARRINRKKDGFRRQLQFIGKLMRSRDVEPIEQALSLLQNAHLNETRKFHQLEDTRDDLLAKGDSAIQALFDKHPELEGDRQKLRQLIRQASKEKQQNKPPKAARELFQYLKENLSD